MTYWRVDAVKFDVGNAFIVNIAYADFLVGLLNIPGLAVMDYYYGRWMLGEIICKLFLAVGYLDTFIPVVIINLLMGYRIMSMSRRAKTRTLVKQRHVTVFIAILWLLLLLFYLFVAFGFPAISGGNYVDYSSQCFLLDYIYVPSFTIVMMVFEFLVPLVLVWSLGITLIIKIQKMTHTVIHPRSGTDGTRNNVMGRFSGELNGRSRNSVRIDKNQTQETLKGSSRPRGKDIEFASFNLPQPQRSPTRAGDCALTSFMESSASVSVPQLPTPATGRPEGAIAIYPQSVRSGPSRQACQPGAPSVELRPIPEHQDNIGHVRHAGNRRVMAFQARDQESEGRAKRMRCRCKSTTRVLTLVSVYLACWLPYVIVNITNAACRGCISEDILVCVELIVICNSLINPFLYAGMNIRFRKGLAKVLHLPCRGRPN